MWDIHCVSVEKVPECDAFQGKHYLRFDFLLAVIAICTWIKAIVLLFTLSETFGPIFKIIIKITIDLSKFLIIWLVIIAMFISASLLIFNETESKSLHITVPSVIVYLLESALGKWHIDFYETVNMYGEKEEFISNVGKVF